MTGFYVGDRIRVFECASAEAANSDRCGVQLPVTAFVDVDYGSGGGTISMAVRAIVPTGMTTSPNARCTDKCVMVASAVDREHQRVLAYAPLSFAAAS